MTVDTSSWLRQHDGAKIWWSTAKPLGDDTQEFLLEKAQDSRTNHIVLGAILSELPQNFVATHTDFVAQILYAGQRHGDEMFRRIASGLQASITSGVRSRAIGIPDPQDVQFRDQFARNAAAQPPGPVRDFFSSMAADMENEIQYHAADDATLLDRRRW
ncbi:hypothetical protein [Arthrobacter sp. MMS18-M83]|uniref:hypothetical protein n=1 Tax=Arthrobacter sp. MMS18-M83 TaxID=2996261 RepID=UPI00227D6802|nr:hypothetical protein [Arthrobacter sp. MMS18-M83]WAH97528.1 hypothetical protein OW521_01090 [Arthrobacter sp. MMS18-M83]